MILSFNGHKSAVTTLAFDTAGLRIASGARDTDIIVWDLVGEVGLFKLRGHKDQITGLQFLDIQSKRTDTDTPPNGSATISDSNGQDGDKASGFLLSTGKDALIKLWDVESQHCVETHVAQSNGECWSMGTSADQSGLITAGNEGELKVWSIEPVGLTETVEQVSEQAPKRCLKERGVLYRQGKDRTIGVSFHPNGNYIATYGSDKSVELWRIRSEGEVQKTLSRKRKRRREKLMATYPNGNMNGSMHDDAEENLTSVDVSEVIVPYVIVRTGGKVRSMCWANPLSSKNLQILVAETNNQLELWNVAIKEKEKSSKGVESPEYTRPVSVELPGHRTDVRALSLSSDDRMLASASNGALKVWNVRTQS